MDQKLSNPATSQNDDWKFSNNNNNFMENDDDETVFSLDEYSQDSDFFYDNQQQGNISPGNSSLNTNSNSNSGSVLASGVNSNPVPRSQSMSTSSSTSSAIPSAASNMQVNEPPIGRLQRETPRQISGERQMYFPAMFVEEFRLGNVVFNIPGILKDSLRPSDSIDIKFDFVGHDLHKDYIHAKLSNLPGNGNAAYYSNSGEDFYDLNQLKNHTISNSNNSSNNNTTTQANLSSSLSTVSS